MKTLLFPILIYRYIRKTCYYNICGINVYLRELNFIVTVSINIVLLVSVCILYIYMRIYYFENDNL